MEKFDFDLAGHFLERSDMHRIEDKIVKFIHSTACIESVPIPHQSSANTIAIRDFVSLMADRYAPYVELSFMYSPFDCAILTMKRRTS